MLREKLSGSVRIFSVDYEALLKSLKERASRIKQDRLDVKRVLLFGSFAKGNYVPESDLDILIEVKDSPVPFLERRDAFVDYFTGLPFDLNILVYTEREMEKMLEEKNAFIMAATEGAVEL